MGFLPIALLAGAAYYLLGRRSSSSYVPPPSNQWTPDIPGLTTPGTWVEQIPGLTTGLPGGLPSLPNIPGLPSFRPPPSTGMPSLTTMAMPCSGIYVPHPTRPGYVTDTGCGGEYLSTQAGGATATGGARQAIK